MTTTMTRSAPIIWVEGVIAAGKSSFAREIAKRLEFEFIEEPVDNNYYLEPFYKDPPKYAFGMQMFLLHYRYAMKQKASYAAMIGDCKGVILDRSIAGDRVFAKLHHDAGNINQLDWRCYNYAYEVMARTIQPPTLFLYLDVQAETALSRMKKRSRNAESAVPIAYLQELKDGYEQLIKELKTGLAPWAHSIEVERIIWDTDTVTDEAWNGVAATINDICRR